MTARRLTKTDWLTAGFDALAGDGPRALAAEPMARRLGTTKGSFYWHFADVPAYHAALVAAWRTAAMQSLSDALSDTAPTEKRLLNFGNAILDDETETALRIWAHRHHDAAAALASVDAERLTYLTLLLRGLGLGNPDFARALLAALIGLPQLDATADLRRATYQTLVDTVLAL